MSIEYVVQEKTVWEVLEVHDDKCYIMAEFANESEADAYKEECEESGECDE